MSSTTQLTTAEQLYHMPDDGFRHELVRGELRKMSPAGFDHGRIAARIAEAILVHNRKKELGEVLIADTGFRLASNPDTVRAPDVAFVSKNRLKEIPATDKFWPGAPDLAVEVLSPEDRTFEVEEKVQEYLAAGARAVWVVSPKARTVTIYRSSGRASVLTSSEVLDGGDVLPGLHLPVSEIFD